MKLTLAWLKSHLETEATLDEIVARLTALGLEVEDVTDPGAALAAFTVGYVIEAKPHPNADRLSVCRIDTGAGEVQVVCGAPNARTGMKGVFAASGLTVPGSGLPAQENGHPRRREQRHAAVGTASWACRTSTTRSSSWPTTRRSARRSRR